MAGGRPTNYTPELGQRIADEIASNPNSLKRICEENEDFPAKPQTIYCWLNKHKEFNDKYLEARKKQMHVSVETLSEQMDENLLYYTDSEGNRRIDSPSATIAIAKANNAKWAASKLAPKYYGTKSEENDNSSQNSVLEKILNGEIEVKKK